MSVGIVGALPIVVTTDLDGDGAEETVTLGTDGSTEVSRNGAVLWRTTGAIDGWNRRPSDDLLSVGIDINSDGKDEVVIYNTRRLDRSTGLERQRAEGSLGVRVADPGQWELEPPRRRQVRRDELPRGSGGRYRSY